MITPTFDSAEDFLPRCDLCLTETSSFHELRAPNLFLLSSITLKLVPSFRSTFFYCLQLNRIGFSFERHLNLIFSVSKIFIFSHCLPEIPEGGLVRLNAANVWRKLSQESASLASCFALDFLCWALSSLASALSALSALEAFPYTQAETIVARPLLFMLYVSFPPFTVPSTWNPIPKYKRHASNFAPSSRLTDNTKKIINLGDLRVNFQAICVDGKVMDLSIKPAEVIDSLKGEKAS